MNTTDDGGPAFPVALPEEGLRWACDHQAGMSLRDYFAAKAMQAELVTCTVPGEAADAMLDRAHDLNRDPIFHMAMNAYEVADAMIKARYA